MAEKKSWRDYSVHYGKDNTTSSKKTGSDSKKADDWRNYSKYGDGTALVGGTVTERVNNWLTNHNSYITSYQDRYSGRKYNYEDSYVSDSADWLNKISQQKSEYDAEADSILEYMEQHKRYLDEKWLNEIKNTITSARNTQSSIIDNVTKDNEYWSSFGNEDLVKQYGSAEDAYKYYQRDDSYRQKYTGMTYDDIQKVFDTIGAGEETDWLVYNQHELYKSDPAYSGKASSGWKSFEAQKIAKQEEEDAKPWWQKAIESFANTPADTSLPNAGLINATVAYQNDKSYREPNDKWSEGQKLHFGYLWEEDKKKAYEYAEQLNNQIAAAEKAGKLQQIQDAASNSGWGMIGHTLGAIATAPLGLADLLDNMTEYAGRGTITEKGEVSPFEYSQAAQSGIANKLNSGGVLNEAIPIIGGKGWGDVYSLGVSAANSLVSAYTMGGTGTLINFIGQGGASGVDDALSRGATPEQALLYGAIVGAAEGVTEMLPADELIKVGSSSTLKNYFKTALKQGVGEFAEEGVSAIIGNVADNLIMQDKSQFNALVKKYMENEDLNEEEAKKKAWTKLAEDAVFDAMGGFVTGSTNAMLVSGIKTGMNNNPNNQANVEALKQYGDKTDALIQEGLQSDVKSDSYKLAQKYQQQTQGKDGKQGKAMTGAQIRNLLAANQEQITPKDMKLIQQAAEKRLTDLGQTNDVSKVAELATKYATGQNLAAAYNKKTIRTLLDAMASTEDPNAYKSLESRTDIETPAKVSDSGKAVISGTDTEIDLTKARVKAIAKDGMVLEVDGKEVHTSEIDFATDEQYHLFNAVKNIEHITPTVASEIIAEVDMEKSIGDQLNGMDEAFTYGFYNYPEADLKAGLFTGNLTEEQLNNAYNLGRYVAKDSIAVDAENIKKMRTAADVQMTAEQQVAQQKAQFASDAEVYFEDGGTVVKFDEHNAGQYDDKRMAGVNAAKFLSKMGIGGKYYFYESYENADGVRVYKDASGNEVAAPNGIYKSSDGSIHIDMNAGDNGEGTTLFTLGHEATHFVKQHSKKQFKALSDLVTETYSKSDMSMHDRVLEKQSRLSKIRGEDVSYDEAFEEVVADAMSTMFADGNIYEKLAELKTKDKGLFDTIKKFFEQLIAKFKKLYEELTPDQKDAQDIRKMKDMFDRIQTAFAEALVEASDNFRASEQVLANAGIGVNAKTDSGSLLSVRDVLNEKDRKNVAKALADRFNVTVEEAMEWLKAETSLASLILNPKYSSFLDYEADPNEVAIKQNSDYPQGTVDFSNICKKRREFTQVMNRILRNFPNHVFAATDLAKIRTIMGEEGMTLPCGICYVEDRRQLDTIVAQDFIDGLKLYREGSKTRPDGKPFNANQLKGLQLTDGDTYVPTIYELVTLEGRNSLKEKNPNMEAAWVRYNNARGMQAVRLLTNEAEYKRQILKYTPKTVKTKNDYGGLRIYSFSDAEMFHLIDIIQVLTDCAAVGLKVQGYTKVNEYAKAVKDTGEKLNRSLIPLGDLGYHMENGKVVLDYDPVEGIDIHSKDFFDSKDNPNVGNIVIGINPTQIRAAMVSDFVDYIIPFHTGQSAEVLGEKGIAAWVNYKDSQSEVDLATGKKSAHQINIYTEVFQAAEDEGKPIRNKRDFVNKFLAVCKENGLKPRFAEFLNMDANGDYVYTEGYHKFLVDFKTFAQTEVGEYLPQMPVKPVFEDAYITGLLEAYVKEQQVKDAEVAEQMPKVIKRITDEIVKPGMDAKYSYRGINKDGIEVYETSQNVMNMSWKDRKAEYLNVMKNEYRGRTAKFERNGHIYYAGFDQSSIRKHIFGDNRSSTDGVKALIKAGADGDVFDLVERSRYTGSQKNKKNHTKADYFDYFVKTVQIDGKVFDLVADVEKTYGVNDGYVYTLALVDNTTKKASPALGTPNAVPVNSAGNAFTNKVAQPDQKVKDNSVRFSERGDGTSNRALLANAFEGITQNSNEYKLIQEYKGRIKLLNEYEEKLSNLNAEIRKITFGTEGVRDYQKLKQLQAEAKQVAEDINRNDKKLLSLEASEPLRKVIERERKKESQKAKAHVKEIQENKKYRAEQTELRHKIRKAIRDLDKILNRGNKKLNVKEDLQPVVTKALQAAEILFTDNYGSYDMLRNGIGTQLDDSEKALVAECAKMLSNIDKMTADSYEGVLSRQEAENRLRTKMGKLKSVFARERSRLNEATVSSVLGELEKAYGSLKDSKDSYVQGAYSEPVHNYLVYLQSEVGGATVQDMTTKQLELVYAAYKMVLTTVRDANKLFVKGKTESIEQMAGRIMGDFSKRMAPDGKMAIIARNIANKIGWDYEKLYYALDRIGSDAFAELVMNIANSENIVMQDIREAAAFRDEMVKKYDFNNWTINKEIDREFLDNTGKKFKLTLGQLMALYAYSRREGAWDHIEYGGFVFGEAALTNPRPADSYKLNKAQCEAITNLLTKEQKGYVEDMQKFLSETMGEKGNEVSMLMYGIKMFNEKNYFPIHIAGQFKAQANESQAKAAEGFQSMSNAGFTHAQNPNAKAPFVLEGFNEIWADHVNEMSRYHGTVPALEDMRKVMNRSFYSESGAESMAIKQMMENSYGKEAVKYFDNLYREANSGAITDKLEKDSKWLLSKFRKNSVAYSLSVLIQQPASIVRAYAMIDKKYFGYKGVGAISSGIAKSVSDKWTKAHTNAYNEMLKYAPGVTMAKEIGGFDTATGGSIRSYLLDTNKKFTQKWKTETATGKGKAVMDLVDNNAVANLPNVADKIAWIEIWNACKREAVAKHKDLAPNSEEFMQAVGERFTEVIRATQVYDSIFAKSPMLKSKRIYVQMLVSFMNEPNTVANMVEAAVRDVTKGNWKQGVRTGAVLLHSIIFTNVLKSIIYAMRDDDEDETYIEKYIEAVTGGMMDDLNALNYIPLLRDVVSVAQGYDVERTDMAIFADLFDAVEKVYKYSNTDTEDMTEEQLIELDKKQTEANWKLVESLAAFIGIPIKNIRREIDGVLDHARIAHTNAGQTTALSAWDKIQGAVVDSLPDFLASKESKTDKLYDAIVSGDKAYLARLKSTYKTDSAYQTAVRKALREGDSRIHDAAQAKINGNTEEYKRIFRAIKDEGKFSFDDIMSAINSEESKIRNGIEPDKVTSSYAASDFVEAIVLGDQSNAQAMRDDIIATHIANGKTEDEAEDAFASAVATGIRDAYYSGLLDKAKAEKMLMEYAGKGEDEAASKVSYWAFIEEHPEYDYFTEANVAKYHEFAEPENISVDVYAQFVNGTKGLKTKYDEWGDVVESERDQILAVIDSLPLTWQQKDALYLAAGYKESKIWDVPW